MSLFDSEEFDCVFYASRIEDIDNPSNHVIFRKGEGEENFVGDSEIIALGGASNETKDRPLG